ncbi:MAG: GTP-binding protein [Candidatus Heimdallarchaeota archaeon]
MTEKNKPIRIILLGNMGVGKTSIAICIAQPATLREGRAQRQIDIDGKEIEIEILDTRGIEMVSELASSYYEGADAAMLIFDLTTLDSFYAIHRWNEELMQHVGDIPKLLIGNKVDLKEARKISRDEAVDLAQRINASYFETSIATETLPFGQRRVRGGRGIFKALRILIEQLIAK